MDADSNTPRITIEPNLTIEPRLTIEARLIAALKRYGGDASSMLDNGVVIKRELVDLLEWYICDCIAYSTRNLKGWWSDGVVQLEITRKDDFRFKLLGVTWIDSAGLAPFEIDVELDPFDEKYFAKTAFRIGMTDEHGLPKLSDPDELISRVLELRPQCDSGWAMAVELTPPETRDNQLQ